MKEIEEEILQYIHEEFMLDDGMTPARYAKELERDGYPALAKLVMDQMKYE